MDAVADRDYIVEFLAAVAVLGMHCSRLAADLALWATAYHLSTGFIGLLGAFSANAISAGIGALVGGRLCDMFGRKKIYQYDMLFYAFGMLWLVFATQPWMIVVGLAMTVAAICMLSAQIEKQTRTTLEFLLHSNEMIIARLERTNGPLVQGEKPADDIASQERRRTQRRNPLTSMLRAAGGNHHKSPPQRRLEDLVQN